MSLGIVKRSSSEFSLTSQWSTAHWKSNRPFIIDLESTNGTHVNDLEIPTSRYYGLHAGDGKLGFSLYDVPVFIVKTFRVQ